MTGEIGTDLFNKVCVYESMLLIDTTMLNRTVVRFKSVIVCC